MVAAQKVGCDLKRFCYGALLLLTTGMLRADTFYVTIAGLGGEPEYEQRFTGWASDLDKIFKSEPASQVTTLSGAQATRAAIQTRLGELAKQTKPDDHLVLLLIGHGSFDESDYKFNIPGPDITAAELVLLLDKIPAQQAGWVAWPADAAVVPSYLVWQKAGKVCRWWDQRRPVVRRAECAGSE